METLIPMRFMPFCSSASTSAPRNAPATVPDPPASAVPPITAADTARNMIPKPPPMLGSMVLMRKASRIPTKPPRVLTIMKLTILMRPARMPASVATSGTLASRRRRSSPPTRPRMLRDGRPGGAASTRSDISTVSLTRDLPHSPGSGGPGSRLSGYPGAGSRVRDRPGARDHLLLGAGPLEAGLGVQVGLDIVLGHEQQAGVGLRGEQQPPGELVEVEV